MNRAQDFPDALKTIWLPATMRPKRTGYYERRWTNDLRYWDGEFWRRGGENGDIVFPKDWRGLKEQEK